MDNAAYSRHYGIALLVRGWLMDVNLSPREVLIVLDMFPRAWIEGIFQRPTQGHPYIHPSIHSPPVPGLNRASSRTASRASKDAQILCSLFILYITNFWVTFLKGQALVDKAGARTDFSYVPGHLGEF